jgi:hypothetical protein
MAFEANDILVLQKDDGSTIIEYVTIGLIASAATASVFFATRKKPQKMD